MKGPDKLSNSRQVAMLDAKDFWITAAEWNTEYGSSYEIGIRRKAALGEFELIQANWNERTVVTAAKGIVAMLDAGMSVREVQDTVAP